MLCSLLMGTPGVDLQQEGGNRASYNASTALQYPLLMNITTMYDATIAYGPVWWAICNPHQTLRPKQKTKLRNTPVLNLKGQGLNRTAPSTIQTSGRNTHRGAAPQRAKP